jgi:hypothetical protein
VRAGWVLALVSGCTFDAALPSSQPGGDDAPPPPPVDTDGDTFLDPEDNCPTTPNMDQRDHDEDDRGDACDGCPHLGDTALDGDGDGIGDACDPRDGIDTVVVFDGFYDDSTALADWTANNGTWEVSGDALRQTDPKGGSVWWQAPIARAYVDLAYVPISVGPAYDVTQNGQTRRVHPSVGTVAGASDPDNHGYGCAIAKDPSNRVTAWSVIDDQWSGTPETWTGDLVVAERYRIVQSLATENACTFAQGVAATSSDSASLGATDGTLAIYTAATAIAFDYVFVVAIGE